MGAKAFVKTIISTSADEGFKQLCQKSDNKLGIQDGYSGIINSTRLKGCFFQDTFSKIKENAARQIVEKRINELDKGECGYIELKEYQWNLITVNNSLYKKNPKFEIRYNVYDSNHSYVTGSKVKSEAVDMAIRQTLATGIEHYYKKEYSIVSGTSMIGKTTIESIDLKTKPRKIKDNQKLIPYHKYIYFGVAPE